MERRLKLVKLAKRWFIHIPKYSKKLEDLELIYGANNLCDILDSFDRGYIDITISTESKRSNFSTKEYVLQLKEIMGSKGAYYTIINGGGDIWLHNIIKQLFREFPKTIYIRL